MTLRTPATAFLACAVSAVGSSSAQPPATLKPTAPDKSRFGYEAFIRADPTEVRPGGTVTLRCEARGSAEAWNLYNPFLSERYKLPAQIFLTSADGKTRLELLNTAEDEFRRSDEYCWPRLGGRTVGRELLVTIGKTAGGRAPDPRTRTLDLAPGEYFVQAVYNHWLIARWLNAPNSAEARPADGTADEPRPHSGWTEARMNEPMAISEPVKITVTGAAAPVKTSERSANCPLRIELQRPTGVTPQEARIPYRITNASNETVTVFNVRLDRRLFDDQRALDLALVTADGEHVGNYTDGQGLKGGRMPRADDWTRFTLGGTVSFEFNLAPPREIPQRALGDSIDVRPGKYFLELRAHEALLSTPPTILHKIDDPLAIAIDPEYQRWAVAFPGSVVCRSNRVELEILPRTGD